MSGPEGPEVLLLDGDYDNTLSIAKELSEDLDARIIGVGTGPMSRLFQSKYCDETAIVSTDDGYPGSLESVIANRQPDVVLPVGYESVAAADAIRDRIPDGVRCGIPPAESLEVAVDKQRTMALASARDVAVPEDYTERVESLASPRGDRRSPDLQRPLILKARRENGESLSTKVGEHDAFWEEYDSLGRRAGGDQILVQDCVTGDGRTYACGLLFDHGTLKLLFGHAELRSVPRHGGSGTRLRVFRDPHLEATSVELLKALDWHGVALVEYRRTEEGYTLMEINPKFWASYALASQCGYRFASTLVAELLDLPRTTYSLAPAMTGERVFPLRELLYCIRNYDEESIPEAVWSMLWPPARWDVEVGDLPAWLTPPASVVQRTPGSSRVDVSALPPVVGELLERE